MELTKRSMDEMIANFNREVSYMDLFAADKIKILGMLTAIGFRYKEDVQFVHAIQTARPDVPDTNVGDIISRQAAIDAIGEKSDEIYKTKQKGATYPHDDFFQGMAYAEDVVKRLPPIQPKRGKWIEDKYGITICSECRKPRRDNRIDHIGWCNACGAKMEVTE